MKEYVVSKGETLFSIGQRCGLSVQRLIGDNALRYPYTIHAGQSLRLQLPSATHTVAIGDSLSSIAQQYTLGLSTLLANNPPLTAGMPLSLGQTLIISFSPTLLQ